MESPIKIIKKTEFNKRPDQEKIWDAISKPWKVYVIKKIKIVDEFLKGKKGKVVDFGCGTGRNMFADGCEYYGVDFSKGQIVQANRKMKKFGITGNVVKGDISNLDKKIFKTKMFDYGLYISTLHCLETPEQRLKSLKEFYRVLKPGAEGLVSVWNSKDQRFKSVDNKGEIYMSWKEQGVNYMRYYYLYQRKELLDLLKKAGFKIVKTYRPKEGDRFSKKNFIVKVKK